MKAKVTRPDGTIIEIEGDPAQVQMALTMLSPAPYQQFTVLGGGSGGGIMLPQQTFKIGGGQ